MQTGSTVIFVRGFREWRHLHSCWVGRPSNCWSPDNANNVYNPTGWARSSSLLDARSRPSQVGGTAEGIWQVFKINNLCKLRIVWNFSNQAKKKKEKSIKYVANLPNGRSKKKKSQKNLRKSEIRQAQRFKGRQTASLSNIKVCFKLTNVCN